MCLRGSERRESGERSEGWRDERRAGGRLCLQAVCFGREPVKTVQSSFLCCEECVEEQLGT